MPTLPAAPALHKAGITTMKYRLAASGASPAQGPAMPRPAEVVEVEDRAYHGCSGAAAIPSPSPQPIQLSPSAAPPPRSSMSHPIRAVRRWLTRFLRHGPSPAWARVVMRRVCACAAVVCDVLRALLARRLATCFSPTHARRRHAEEEMEGSASELEAEQTTDGTDVDVRGRLRNALRRSRRRQPVRVISAAHVLRRAVLITCLGTLLVVLLWVALDASIGLVLQLSGGAMSRDMPEDFQIPWLDCDCAGLALMGDAASGELPLATEGLRAMRAVADVGCSLCSAAFPVDGPPAVYLNASGALLTRDGDGSGGGGGGGLAHALAGLPIVATVVAVVHAMAAYGIALAYSFATVMCPNTMLSIASGWASYTAYLERRAAARRRGLQNRGLAGGSVEYGLQGAPRTPPASLIGVARGPWRHYAADATPVRAALYTSNYLVASDQADGQLACTERAPLRRLFFTRHALPWLTITAAAHRTQEAWALEPRGRDALLPFPIAASLAARAQLRAAVRGTLCEFDLHDDGSSGVGVECRVAGSANTSRTDATQREEQADVEEAHGRVRCPPPRLPEITVSITDERKEFQSFLCSDVPNASGPAVTTVYHLDPVRAALLARLDSGGGETRPRDEPAPATPPAPSRCVGCVFHCVHPRLARARASQRCPRDGGEGDGCGGPRDSATPRAAGATPSASPPPPPLSWEVSLEDVDAGLVHAGRGSADPSPRRVTRADLFTCKILSPERGDANGAAAAAAAGDPRDAPAGAAAMPRSGSRTNAALLLSTDVWLTHFGDGVPHFFVRDAKDNATMRRLMPLHTAAVYGESLQSFPDYAMRPTYWLQFDAVYLQNPVRRPALLPQSPRPRTPRGAASGGDGTGDGVGVNGDRRVGADTEFDTWTVTHTYLRDFQLVVHLNQLRQRAHLQHPHAETAAPSPLLLRARGVPAAPPYAASDEDVGTEEALHTTGTTAKAPPPPPPTSLPPAMTRGALARLAYELLHGADPLLLPLHGENVEAGPGDFDLAWRPPTTADWARPGRDVEGVKADDADAAHAAGGLPRPPLRLPFSAATGRLPAIAVSISHCWHARMWWLSELSRYYPVHNYGRCIIPPPVPRLPGDVEGPPAAASGALAEAERAIPRRAQLALPLECSAARITRHHDEALRSLWRSAEGRGRRRRRSDADARVGAADGGAPHATGSRGREANRRRLTHVGRDHELRCVFRKYRYVMAFENTIEDDYVTEKVYNALLSGALPLYIGAMNVADYVPHVVGNTSATASASSLRGLSVLPVLQVFPLLNETAWRAEERRILQLRDYDEAVSRQVLHLHAGVLRARAAAADAARAHDAAARDAPAENSPVDPLRQRHTSAVAAAATLADALEAVAALTPHDVARDHYLLYNANASATLAAPSVRLPASYRASAGVWPSPSPSPSPSQAPGLRGGATDTASTAGEVLGYGQEAYLRSVHEHVRAAEATARLATSPDVPPTKAEADPRGRGPHVDDAGRATATRTATHPSRGRYDTLRRVRFRIDQDWALTANTAWGFSEDVNRSAAQRRDALGGVASATRRVVQTFADAPISTPNLTAPGGAYSRYFPRRSLPRTPACERVLAADPATRPRDRDGDASAADAAPMNGFAQLAAYLRALDADPSLIDEAGYFDWWRAASMEELGTAFLEKVYKPHPICGICAAALEKKEAMVA